MGNRAHLQSGTTAVFDVGASSVGAALITIEGKNAKPQVVYATRALFPFLKEPEPDRITQAMLSTFVVVALRLQREGLPRLPRALPFRGGRVHQAVCFFSSPWHSTDVSTVSVQKDAPFTIPKDLSSMLFPEDPEYPRVEFIPLRELNTKSAKKSKSAPAVKRMGGAVSIERHIIGVALNGYPTARPVGKSAKSLEALVVGSVVPEDIYNKLSAIIDKVLHGGELFAHSFFIPLARVARGIAGENSSYLLVHVGGEICDVVVIREGIPALFVSIPFGVQPLIRAVAEKAKIIPEEVGARLALLAQGGSGKEDRKGAVIVRTLSEIEGKWKDLVREALRQSPFRAPLPNTVYLWSDALYLPWFTRLFSLIALPEATFNTTPFVVHPIDKSAFEHFISFAHEEEFDGALGAEGAFIGDLSGR